MLRAPIVRSLHRSLAVRGHLVGVTVQALHDPAGTALHIGAQRLHVLLAGRHRAAARRRIVRERRQGEQGDRGQSEQSSDQCHEISPWGSRAPAACGRQRTAGRVADSLSTEMVSKR
jgi:hypothetical protein